MSAPKFLLAKYIADLRRMEPINVGVIVWVPGAAHARFLGEKVGQPGEINGIKVRGTFANWRTDSRWVRYWRAQIASEKIPLLGTGTDVSIGSEAFFDALKSGNRGNFILADGGEILDDVPTDDLPAVADFLFRELVETVSEPDAKDPDLNERANAVFREMVGGDSHYHTGFKVRIGGGDDAETAAEFVFSDAYANGSIARLYQRVPLAGNETMGRKSANSTAWQFARVVGANKISKAQGAALIFVPDMNAAAKWIRQCIHEMADVTRIINLADPDELRNELRSLPLLFTEETFPPG